MATIKIKQTKSRIGALDWHRHQTLTLHVNQKHQKQSSGGSRCSPVEYI